LAVEKGNRLRVEQAQADKLQKALGAHGRLMDVVLSDSSLRGVSATIEALLPHAFIVVDATAGQIVCGRSPAPDHLSEAAWRDLLASKAARHLVTLARTFEPSEASRPLDFRPWGVDFNAPATVAPLTVDGERVGAFIVFPGADPLDDLELLVANAVKFALAAQMMRGLISFRVETRSLSDLIGQLFRGEWSSREDMVGRAAQLGLPLDRPTRLLVIAAPAGAASDGAYFLGNLTRTARGIRQDARAVADGGDIVIVVPGSDTEGDRTWARLANRVTEEAQSFSEGAIVAASGVCYRLEDFGAAREACRRAINLARMFGKQGLIAESEFGPYALLLSAMDREAMRRFVQDRLGPILAYDSRHGGDLVPTLEAFLASGCRYQACADAMGIHVTTLRYRLSRVSELFNISLEDPDSRFGLDLALRLQRMMEPLARP
jgi:purine catabolism regulator